MVIYLICDANRGGDKFGKITNYVPVDIENPIQSHSHLIPQPERVDRNIYIWLFLIRLAFNACRRICNKTKRTNHGLPLKMSAIRDELSGKLSSNIPWRLFIRTRDKRPYTIKLKIWIRIGSNISMYNFVWSPNFINNKLN